MKRTKPPSHPTPDADAPHDFTLDAGLVPSAAGGRSWQAGVMFLCKRGCGASRRVVTGGSDRYYDAVGQPIEAKERCGK